MGSKPFSDTETNPKRVLKEQAMADIIQQKVKVLSNTALGPGYHRIRLSCHRQYASAAPGQFVMVRLIPRIDALLPRPFSIHRLIRQDGLVTGLELLFKVVGQGTQALALKNPGDTINLTGPLGKGFSVPAEAKQIKIVAGGIGVAPMIFFLDYLKDQGRDLSKIQVFLGGKSKGDLLCIDDFTAFGVSVHATTDDGSSGDQCLVTDPLEIAVVENQPDIIYACGPMDMLRCIAGIAAKYRIACQVSIETMMACGMGACLGCAVPKRHPSDAYWHACLDGPVFDINALLI
jgi:dihydroorotate dehydrogenase electron transfer subunit